MKSYQVIERDPGGRPPAPEPLRGVQAFVNTVDLEHGVEGLTAPAPLEELLGDHGLLTGPASVSQSDVERARELREVLRDLLLVRHGGELSEEAVATLERTGRGAGLVLAAGRDGTLELVPIAAGADAAFGRLLAIVYGAMADGTWRRLKACPGDRCKWAFWDASPAVSGIWCSMEVCGNRTKTGRYRRTRARGAV
jgi:predicted RNA-binding Zn ribbon-like protein